MSGNKPDPTEVEANSKCPQGMLVKYEPSLAWLTMYANSFLAVVKL